MRRGRTKFTYITMFLLFLLFSLGFVAYEYYLLKRLPPIWIYYAIVLIMVLFTSLLYLKTESIIFSLGILAYFKLMVKVAFLSPWPSPILITLADYRFYAASRTLSESSFISSPNLVKNFEDLVVQPLAPILYTLCSQISGISEVYTVKYFPLIYSALIPFTLYLMYKPLESRNRLLSKMSILLFVFSPYLLNIDPLYLFLSIQYLAIIVYVLIKTSGKYISPKETIVYIIISLALVFAHFSMTGLGLVIILGITSAILLLSDRKKSHHAMYLGLVYITAFLTYLIFYAPRRLLDLTMMWNYLLDAVGSKSLQSINYYAAPKVVKYPAYVQVIQYGGFILWIIMAILGFLLFLSRSIKSQKQYTLLYGNYIWIIGAGVLLGLPYIFDPKYGTDLFLRAVFLYGFWGGAPFATKALLKLNKKSKKLGYIALVFMLSFGFTLVPAYYQSWNYPIVGGEDIRLFPSEWHVAGAFVRNNIDKDASVCGLRQGFYKIGMFADIKSRYIEIQPSVSNVRGIISPDEWTRLPKFYTNYCFLRRSIVDYQEVPGYGVKKEIFDNMYILSNVIYSGTDVFGIYIWG
ncbi:hypothetical protein [Thermococcus zilligii]|uniref:hypothetical protein n=1 Tax=Thermococcus zilligii TaxID=54076 RepID=UPI00029AEE06|nr:hypothetical protein [Thermococcus zilligii]